MSPNVRANDLWMQEMLHVAPLNPSSHRAFLHNPRYTLFVGRADPAPSIHPLTLCVISSLIYPPTHQPSFIPLLPL